METLKEINELRKEDPLYGRNELFVKNYYRTRIVGCIRALESEENEEAIDLFNSLKRSLKLHPGVFQEALEYFEKEDKECYDKIISLIGDVE